MRHCTGDTGRARHNPRITSDSPTPAADTTPTTASSSKPAPEPGAGTIAAAVSHNNPAATTTGPSANTFRIIIRTHPFTALSTLDTGSLTASTDSPPRAPSRNPRVRVSTKPLLRDVL